MPLNNVHDLFEHELKDIYGAEKKILGMLQQIQEEAQNPDVRQAVEQHVQETETQIRRIEGVFSSMNLEKGSATCAAMEGMSKEKREFDGKNPAKEIRDVFNVSAGMKTEHYEISAYESLIELANKAGMQDAVRPLEENLREERAMLDRLKDVSKNMQIGQTGGGQKQGQTQSRGTQSR